MCVVITYDHLFAHIVLNSSLFETLDLRLSFLYSKLTQSMTMIKSQKNGKIISWHS